MLASRADVYTIRCSCKQWPCTYTAPCVARTCWEESQTHIAATLWQRRSTHTARTLMHATNATRRGRSCTDQQHRKENAQHHPHTHNQTARRPTLDAVQHSQTYTISHPDSTKARPTIKSDRLFLLCDGTGHRPAAAIRQDATALSKPVAVPERS